MYVIEVYDRTTGAAQFYKGVLASCVFDAVDDSLTEANGWHKVRMSVDAYNAFIAKIGADMKFSKKFWLS